MTGVAISLAVGIATLFAVVASRYAYQMMRWLNHWLRWQRGEQGLCRTCGYDLRGNAGGVCPECGGRFDLETSEAFVPPPSLLIEALPWWVWTVVVAAMVAAGVIFHLR